MVLSLLFLLVWFVLQRYSTTFQVLVIAVPTFISYILGTEKLQDWTN